jgi:hypothetical protein
LWLSYEGLSNVQIKYDTPSSLPLLYLNKRNIRRLFSSIIIYLPDAGIMGGLNHKDLENKIHVAFDRH